LTPGSDTGVRMTWRARATGASVLVALTLVVLNWPTLEPCYEVAAPGPFDEASFLAQHDVFTMMSGDGPATYGAHDGTRRRFWTIAYGGNPWSDIPHDQRTSVMSCPFWDTGEAGLRDQLPE
jgi:hypothetical protein